MKEKSCSSVMLLLAFSIVNTIVGIIIGGFVMMKIWQWFAVPVFGVQQIALVPAIGIGLLISFLTHQHIPQPEGREISKVIGESIGEAVLYPIIVLFFGWVVSLFM
jgi:hypothetical protein